MGWCKKIRAYLGLLHDGKKAKTILDKYITKLRKHGIKIHSIIVIGSRAYGYHTTSSDIDIVVIIEDYNKIREAIKLSLGTGYIEPRIYAKEDIETLLECYDAVLLEALEFGAIYYDDGTWTKLRKKYSKKIKKNVEFITEKGKIIAIKIKTKKTR
ncbi:MAG: nucleotidyltransferase domain-containing protein [Candidatus Njordarchaeota archaeon]